MNSANVFGTAAIKFIGSGATLGIGDVVAIDDDPRACYFRQVANGKYMRMALILKLLKEAGTI